MQCWLRKKQCPHKFVLIMDILKVRKLFLSQLNYCQQIFFFFFIDCICIDKFSDYNARLLLCKKVHSNENKNHLEMVNCVLLEGLLVGYLFLESS
jgi:hypothetical protein